MDSEDDRQKMGAKKSLFLYFCPPLFALAFSGALVAGGRAAVPYLKVIHFGEDFDRGMIDRGMRKSQCLAIIPLTPGLFQA
jgi:hypothetical protein